jgi:hypothetical protein
MSNAVDNNQVRHRRPTAHARARYRCFLPDLAGLAGVRRAGPMPDRFDFNIELAVSRESRRNNHASYRGLVFMLATTWFTAFSACVLRVAGERQRPRDVSRISPRLQDFALPPTCKQKSRTPQYPSLLARFAKYWCQSHAPHRHIGENSTTGRSPALF